MESNVAQRVKSILKERQISITALSKMIGMQQVTCNRQIRGDQSVSLGLIEGFLQAFPDISAEWLMRGTGSINLADEDAVDPKYDLRSLKQEQSDSVWQAKYEELEKRYDQLLDILGGNAQKRNVG